MVRERVSREGRLGKAVEFGCGTGFFTETLAGKADSLVATDLSPGMLELARARVRAPNVTFQAEDCQATTFPSDAFDTAFAVWIAPLLAINSADDERNPPELGILDREIKRVKNGGVLLIPASEKTTGHATTFRAVFWKQELAELLKNAPRASK